MSFRSGYRRRHEIDVRSLKPSDIVLGKVGNIGGTYVVHTKLWPIVNRVEVTLVSPWGGQQNRSIDSFTTVMWRSDERVTVDRWYPHNIEVVVPTPEKPVEWIHRRDWTGPQEPEDQ